MKRGGRGEREASDGRGWRMGKEKHGDEVERLEECKAEEEEEEE